MRLSDLSVPLAAGVVLAGIVLPLPASVLNVLLLLNLAVSVVLFLTSLHLQQPLQLSALPPLLLLLALFRLSLNIGTTRAILSQGHAGEVVATFGKLVIQGNVIVGITLFLMITLVQLIVVVKGSERVAEVGARFTLDALPGKQMAIDADVRAGLLDYETAKQRRDFLQLESRFYGALDGAMKFIKGDAIVGIASAFINILGGIAVGVLDRGMGFGEAMQTYAILSVGDGLLTQIPALLNALSAGVIVSRVASDSGASVSNEIVGQLGQRGDALFMSAMGVLGLAFVPGMPTFTCGGLACILLGIFLTTRAKSSKPHRSPTPVQQHQPRVPPILEVIVPNEGDDVERVRLLNEMSCHVQRGVYERTGLLLGELTFTIAERLPKVWYLRSRGVVVLTPMPYSFGSEPIAELGERIVGYVTGRAPDFVDEIQVRRLQECYERCFPDCSPLTGASGLLVPTAGEVCRQLLKENIPIRNLDVILQVLQEGCLRGKTDRVILEEVRIGLKQLVCANLPLQDGKLLVLTLDAMTDTALVQTERGKADLDPLLAIRLVEWLQTSSSQGGVVVLATRGARRLLREILDYQRIPIPVIASEELVQEVETKIVAKFCIAQEDLPESLTRLAA